MIFMYAISGHKTKGEEKNDQVSASYRQTTTLEGVNHCNNARIKNLYINYHIRAYFLVCNPYK
jgi:hypothetical protein